MRLVVQRVESATVSVKDSVIGRIGKGLLVLFGAKEGDTRANADFLAEKLSKLRVMSDEQRKINFSVRDVSASILVVSQFTLYADTSAGNRPSFIKVAKPDVAKDLYNYFIQKLKDNGIKVETGKFGAYMQIDASLDGPVTIILESQQT